MDYMLWTLRYGLYVMGYMLWVTCDGVIDYMLWIYVMDPMLWIICYGLHVTGYMLWWYRFYVMD